MNKDTQIESISAFNGLTEEELDEIESIDGSGPSRDVLIQAAENVVAAVPDAYIAIIGDGSLRAELEAERARSPVADRVLMPGFREPMMRIWIDRDKLAAHRLAVDDIIIALGRENLELPGGFIEGPQIELAIRNLGLFETVEEFDSMIVSTVNGRPIRLRDVGFTQLSVADERGGVVPAGPGAGEDPPA